jgi:hypothetical protein
VARYLSDEWFAQVTATGAAGNGEEDPAIMVLEQVVEGTPSGRVAYRVAVGKEHARIVWPLPADAPSADLRFSCDWTTAVAMAKGDLSAQRALMEGRLRVKGSPARLASEAVPAGLDPVPAPVRAATTY